MRPRLLYPDTPKPRSSMSRSSYRRALAALGLVLLLSPAGTRFVGSHAPAVRPLRQSRSAQSFTHPRPAAGPATAAAPPVGRAFALAADFLRGDALAKTDVFHEWLTAWHRAASPEQ